VRRIGCSRALIALALLFGAAETTRAEQPAPPVAVRQITLIQAAQLLMQAGKLTEAKRVLEDLRAKKPDDSEVLFLLGMIAVQEKDYPLAIHYFHAVLVHHPKVVRVRLELARAFYLKKDYDNAERQFRFARAGNPPPGVRANIDAYLNAIRLARRWTYSLTLGLAPDTNINVGPSVNTVTIYGLPFQLSNNSRPQSGLGLALDASDEWSPPIGPGTHFRLGADFHMLGYQQSAFDDMTLGLYAGPRFVTGKWDISPLITGFRRWYGNQFYNEGIGGSLQVLYYPRPRLGLNAVIGAQDVTYAPPVGQGGPAISGSMGFFYTLDPASTLFGSVSVTRQDAQLNVFSNTAVRIALGFYRDLPAGYTVSVQPSYVFVDYDAALPLFTAPRRDRQWAVQLTLLNRRIDVLGFTPRLMYTHTHNGSDISLYAYDRDQVQIGLTRAF
jgi:tetratricopeptide (TPR) repeat protein